MILGLEAVLNSISICSEQVSLEQRSSGTSPVQLDGACDIVIVNYNAGGFLSESVLSSWAAGASRVIVVDNASRDDSLESLMPLQGGELCIVRNASNLGFSAACNIGARHTSAPYVLFLNPDCVLAADALSCMIQALVSYPRTGMVGGFLCNPDGTEQPGGRRVFPTPKRAFLRAFGLSRLSKFLPASFSDFLLHEQPLPREPLVVEAISGACMLVRREAIEDVGLWDEGYFLHCEDLDWCMRFRQAGWDVLYVPGARVSHQFGVCSRSRPYFVEWHKHRGMLRFYQKFFRHQYPGGLWVGIMIGVWLRFSLVVARRSVMDVVAFFKQKKGG
ncbi:glycosyltransferase family 2 protein [Pseudomonas gingeri]|uniref:Glycosyltransferase family 2 protein n=1 Tax=Pseudomonas gingeri TaxID=117681 RepID=A0A7Y8C086_9PSED|nr:glycosyltransferase family 2 protein [Pseudomonas gingeri]NWB95175.1 glycosyltransferase family 2 protein [Pseudomonas gingeri]